MSDFKLLSETLKPWFEKSFHDVPEELHQRIKECFFPMLWDNLHPDQRRTIARQWDYHNDPSTENERDHLWDVGLRVDELKRKIERLEKTSTPTPTEIEKQEKMLTRYMAELRELEQQLDFAEALNEGGIETSDKPGESIELVIPDRQDDWSRCIIEAAKEYQHKNGTWPQEHQLWGALCTNPPRVYRVTPCRDRGVEALCMAGSKPLDRDAFRKRHHRLFRTADNAR